jgi:hypothetical protein
MKTTQQKEAFCERHCGGGSSQSRKECREDYRLRSGEGEEKE